MKWFSSEKKEHSIADDGDSLKYYDYRGNEAKASVVESGDYAFASTVYTSGDFRHDFVNEYIRRFSERNDYNVLNLRIQRPRTDSSFLNCYIYLDSSEYGTFHRLDNKDNALIEVFYEVLAEHSLPAISKELRVQFIIRDYSVIQKANAANRVWSKVQSGVLEKYEEVESLSFFGSYYIFIKSSQFS